MFIELTAIFEGEEEKALFNIEHIVVVRKREDHSVICFKGSDRVFSTIDVKESYQRVLRMIEDMVTWMRDH